MPFRLFVDDWRVGVLDQGLEGLGVVSSSSFSQFSPITIISLKRFQKISITRFPPFSVMAKKIVVDYSWSVGIQK